VPEMSASIGRRSAIMQVHVVAGLFLPIPLLFAVALGPAGARFGRDLAELSRWTAADRRWFRRKGRGVTDGKFNGGQKLVTALFAGVGTLQLLTGSVMFWHDPFSTAWRTGATFVHDWAYLLAFAVVVGHVVKALDEPVMLRAMATGEVPEEWAERERPTWDPHAVAPGRARPDGATFIARGKLMVIRLVGGVLLALVGIVWILQGVNVLTGSGMSDHPIWAVFGVVLLLIAGVLLRSANASRTSARS
jgi:formate dehydrogenase subunit gamma